MLRKNSMPLAQLKSSKVAGINQELIKELEQAPKPKLGQASRPLWMWGQLVAWSLKSGIEVVKEFPFHAERGWRFDFALPAKMVGIEYEGIFSKKSGHTTQKGYVKDVEKYREAEVIGWTVFRFTAKDYRKVIETIEKHLEC